VIEEVKKYMKKQNPINEYLSKIKSIIEEIEKTQIVNICKGAKLCSESIFNSGLIHVFGVGHSRAIVEEMFPRYGSFPGFNPIVELSLTFHSQIIGPNGQAQAMYLENVDGFGDIIYDNINMSKNDSVIIISNSGVSKVIIDFALQAKSSGHSIIGVVSVDQCKSLHTKHEKKMKIIDIADVIIDTCNPVGDALLSINGIDDKIGPGSTIASAIILNSLKCKTAQDLVERGFIPNIFVNPYFGETYSKDKIKICWDEFRKQISELYKVL
jgi:uncharacterized phosphosugar-binding protein